MAENSDEHPSFEVIFPSEDASRSPENQETSLAIIDSQNQGGDLSENTKAISQLPSLRPVISKSCIPDPQPSTSHNSEEDSRSFIAIETEPSTSKPPTPRLSRNDDLLRSRFMRRHDVDPFTGRSYHDFGYFNDSSHAFPGSQALPWNPINNFRQSYYPGYSPLVLPVPPMPPMPPTPVPTVSSSRPGHLPPSLFQIAPSQIGKTAEDEPVKLNDFYDHLVSAEAKDGSSKSTKAAENDSKGPGSFSVEVYKSTQAEAEATSSKSRDVETLLEALKAERDKSRKLEMELQIKRGIEAEHDKRLAQIEAKNERLQRELEGQKQTQEDALARLEGQNRHQERLHKDQFDKLQQIMDKFGEHMIIIEQHENERRAEERRQEEEEEAKKIEEEMNQREEEEEENEREEQLRIEEQLRMEEQERLEQERRQEEEKRRTEEQERDENQRSEERIHQMAEMIFQKLREDWAQKEAAEAQRRAEEERRKLEQEEKERREREERERLAEKIRLEKEQRTREAERKQQEEDRKHAAEEQVRKQIDEEVKRNVTAKLKAEIERLQSDLRRHTQGARPDLTNGRGLTQPRPEPVFDQEQLDWDPTWRFPPSNPFSRNRRRIRSHHHHEPRALEDSRRLLQFDADHAFDSPQGQTRSASDRPANQPPYFGETSQTRQSAASTPVPQGLYSQYGEDSVYEGDEGGVPQNPWIQVQRTRSHESSRPNQLDAQSNAGSSSAFANRNGFNGMEMPGQYPSERYASDVNAANAQNFQHTSLPHDIDRTGTPSAISQTGLGQDVGETYMNENDPMAYAMYLVEDTSRTSESSPIQDWNGLHETKPRGYPQANGRLGTPRPHNHRSSLEPPSAPSPPTQTSPRSASGRSSRQTPTLNGNRIFSEGRRTAEGFPPPPSTAPSSPPLVQYLPLEQVKALTASKNLPVIMMPVVPLYSIQFAELDEQTDAGEAKDGETEEEEEEEEEEQVESANPYMVNGL